MYGGRMRGTSRVPLSYSTADAVEQRRVAPDPFDQLLDESRVAVAAEHRRQRADRQFAAHDSATIRGVLLDARDDAVPVCLGVAGERSVAGRLVRVGIDTAVVDPSVNGWSTAVALRAVRMVRPNSPEDAQGFRTTGSRDIADDVDLREIAQNIWEDEVPCVVVVHGQATAVAPLASVGDDVLVVRSAEHSHEVVALTAVQTIAWRGQGRR